MTSVKRSRSKRTPEQLAAIDGALKAGGTIEEALVAGGYSPLTAKRGRAALGPAERDIVMSDLKHYAAIGAMLNPALVKNGIVGRLASNVVTGSSAGNEAAKLLGGVKDYDIFRPESQQGIIVIQMPESLAAKPDPMQLEATEVLDLGKPKLLGS